jgi:hypothetical protein
LVVLAVAIAGCGSMLPGRSPVTTATPASPPPASLPVDPLPVEVVETGVTPISAGGSDVASFAAVLRNPNETWDVRRLLVHVDVFDAAGAFVGGEEVFMSLAAGQTGAIAGELFGGGSAARLDVVPQEDASVFGAAGPAPLGLEVTVAATVTSDATRTSGTIESRLDEHVSAILLTAVYRDAEGRIIGGAVGSVDAIEAGGRVPFEIVGLAVPGIVTTDVHWSPGG